MRINLKVLGMTGNKPSLPADADLAADALGRRQSRVRGGHGADTGEDEIRHGGHAGTVKIDMQGHAFTGGRQPAVFVDGGNGGALDPGGDFAGFLDG